MSATLTLAAPLAAPPPGPDDLRIEGLVKRFGATEVLRGVRLRVPRGQLCALIGANGAGKSTLLRSLLRLVEPDAGAIEVLGEPLPISWTRLRA